MTGGLVRRAIIAATAGHITIADGPARVDAQFDSLFPAEALCQAMQGGFQALARLTREDNSPLTEQLAAAGLIESAPTESTQVPGTIPLARALSLVGDAPAARTVVYTADEAFWPGNDPALARQGFRIFVSRLSDIARCAIYAALASGGEVCVAGDEPPEARLRHACRTVENLSRPCAIEFSTGKITGILNDSSDIWTGHGKRLSIVSRTHSEQWQINPATSLTWVRGIAAFSNLSALPQLHEIENFKRLSFVGVSGIDADPELAEVKCLAEGAERYSAGDIESDRMRYAAASALQGRWLDPNNIISYSAAQRSRLTLAEFDTDAPEWWVHGHSHGGKIWIPAALVFYPFTQQPSWLRYSAISSSGMAAHRTLDDALRLAWLELVERDAFQRARLTGSNHPPAQVCTSKLTGESRAIIKHLARYAETRVLFLPSPAEIPVALVQAETDQGIVLGAGAAPDFARAVAKAAVEALTQVIYPFAHEIAPDRVETPEDHAALYSTPAWKSKLDWMSQGPAIDPEKIPTVVPVQIGKSACWYELRPRLPDLHVVRVLDPDLIPLTFGYDSDPTGRKDVSALMRIFDYSDEIPLAPHPFA